MIRATAAVITLLAIAQAAQAQETYSLAGPRVSVSGPSGDLRVERGTGSNVVVEVHRRGPDADKVKIEQDTEDGYTRLRVVYPKNRWGFRNFRADIDLTIRVPDGKDLRLSTASGDIHIGSINTTRLAVHTASGDVDARALTGESIEFSTASGNVEIAEARTPELRAHTASGDVRVDLSGDVRSIEASTASGDITVGVPENFGGNVSMSTASGDLESDFPMTLIEKDRRSLRARIGNGNARASFHTASGDVRLTRR